MQRRNSIARSAGNTFVRRGFYLEYARNGASQSVSEHLPAGQNLPRCAPPEREAQRFGHGGSLRASLVTHQRATRPSDRADRTGQGGRRDHLAILALSAGAAPEPPAAGGTG